MKKWGVTLAIIVAIGLPSIAQSKSYIVHLKSPNTTFAMQVAELNSYKRDLEALIKEVPHQSFKRPTHTHPFMVASQKNRDILVIQPQLENNADFLEQLSNNPLVDIIEENYPISLFSQSKNDTYYTRQSYLKNTDLNKVLGLEGEHSIKVAVIDTGVDFNHSDLANKIEINVNEIPDNNIDDDKNGYIDDRYGYNFYGYSTGAIDSSPMDEHSHGTHIASIIAAESNNEIGIVGINQNVSIIGIRFLDSTGAGSQADAAAAIYYAVQRGANIINCSWGYYKANTVLKEAVQYAIENGVIVVAAVGNTASDVREYPSALPGVIGVGSVETNLELSSFSSFGTSLDFSIYGRNIYGALLNDSYGYKTGTSQSAAIMTGLISIILSQDNTVGLQDINLKLQHAASNGKNRQFKTGFGTIQALTFLESIYLSSQEITTVIYEETDTNTLTLESVYNYPNPIVSNSTTFGFETAKEGAQVTISIYDLEGKKMTTLEDTTVNGYNRVNWNLTDELNGTYLYIVELKDGSEVKTERQKLAVIR